MPNVFASLPTPAGNGAGAWIDVSTFGPTKTVAVTGNGTPREPIVTIECSNQLTPTKQFPLKTFANPGEDTFNVACHWMRAVVSNFQGGGAPVVSVGSTADTAVFAQLTVPPAKGIGPALDVSALPLFKTVQVAGPFRGAVVLEVSEDGGTTFSQAISFSQPGQQTAVIAADFMRVTRAGSLTVEGDPTVWVAATNPPGGAPAGGGGGAPTPTKLAYFYDDFITGQALVGVISGSITASITLEGDSSSIDLINDPDTQSIGVIDLHSQASEATNASASFSLGAVAVVKFGSPAMPTLTQEWRVKADAAPTALSDFFLAIGMTDTPSYPLAQGAGPLFLAGFAEFGNGNWWVSSQGQPFSPANCTDTGVPVTTNWARLTIVIPDGDTQMYFIDGVQVGGTQTNDLESLEAGIAIQIRTPDGTQAHSLFADYVLCTYPINRGP